MKMSKLLASLLKTAVYIMDQTSEQADRLSDRASNIADSARDVFYPEHDHTLRNLLTFAAGVGVGIGAGMLLAPASGAETRDNITNRVRDISETVKGRTSGSTRNYATGTE